ncbi:MAG: YifB family Mg chelatase-like AAA ATPase [Pseudomonadota bacterium]
MHITTFVFRGIDVVEVEVQVQLTGGVPNLLIVGLPDKAVGESRERVRAAIHALGLSLPPKRVTINLAPADVLKEGSHYDLPIALALLCALEVIPLAAVARYSALGELSLDGTIRPVGGVLPAAVDAAGRGLGLICPEACGSEAAWAIRHQEARKDSHNAPFNDPLAINILAAPSLGAVIDHFAGKALLLPPAQKIETDHVTGTDLKDMRGQEAAKRVLEIAAAGGHHMLMRGPPGAGKSLLAMRLPGLLPPLSPDVALKVSMIHSVARTLPEGAILRHRPFRAPHHNASLPSLVGGGTRAGPGEISLAHGGVLFLDELPEFSRAALDGLRQSMETGETVVSRANAHVTYPSRYQLVAAMNPCRCGYFGEPQGMCSRAPGCAETYQARISGPIMDRIDLFINMSAVRPDVLAQTGNDHESSATVRARVIAARQVQQARYADSSACNAHVAGEGLEADLSDEARSLLTKAVESFHLSARGYYRAIKVARTIADLAGQQGIDHQAIGEALAYRWHRP